jgi:RNA polymerase sigma factor (sigma-70 family)
LRSEGGVAVATPAPHHRDAEGPTDHQLVAAVRRGDDRAFETLYHRYNRRIQAYVFGMCKDHARAEDITQEIFVSALRRMRETERPIAFKPWIYEIAKNACIDQHRRSRRAEEISLQAEDGLAPADYGRLVNADPTPDVAVTVKQSLDHLCGAFGGLSDTHHDILVMRELEGLSYREIGERLGMSRPAVESTLFRARRRLTEEYGELVSGQRCLRIQGIIATAARGRLGARDATRLSRHVAHCIPCRREAMTAGLDPAMLRKPLRTRVAAKVAALLPFPLLTRRFGTRGGGDDAAANSMPTSWMAHLPLISDHVGAGWTKAFAAVAVLLAGVGAGVGTQAASTSAQPATGAGTQVHERAISSSGGGAAARGPLVAPRGDATRSLTSHTARHSAQHAKTVSTSGTTGTSGTTRTAASGSSPATPVHTATDATKPVVAKTPVPSGGGSLSSPASSPAQVVQQTTQSASNTVSGVTNTVNTVTNAVSGATSGTAGGATGAVGGAVGGTVGAVGNTVGNTGSAAGGAIQSTGNAVSGALGGVTG